MTEAKLIVREAYDHLAPWYLSWMHSQKSPRERYTLKVLSNASKLTSNPHPTILDLGCGPGIPTTQLLLAQGARVIANDISQAQIATARSLCPTATFIPGDMASLCFKPGSLDGVVCFFTLFHLPRLEQKAMLARVFSWLKAGALLACNFATVDEEEIYGEMMGRGIFWSGFGVERNRMMVRDVGFEVVGEEVLESEADGGMEFMWVVARKS